MSLPPWPPITPEPAASPTQVVRRVDFAPEALEDLRGLYDRLAEASSPDRAFAYVDAIRRHVLGFATFPERGTRRDHFRPGLRTTGYRRRVTVAFLATDTEVTILRILSAGRDVDMLLREDQQT